jgi:hypothetical protein
MITKNEYLKAKKIVDDYKEQLRIAEVMRAEKLAEEQRKREVDCGEHYYLDGPKWTSYRQCQFCGKKI